MDPVVPDLVQSSTEALQALERLQIQLRPKREESATSSKVYHEVCRALDSLRDVKSELEQTAIRFEAVTVRDAVLHELRGLTLAHVPGTMTTDVKEKMRKLIVKAFNGTCKNVLFAALVTCPWYRATQSDRGIQAKHNTVFVVYSNKDKQLFAPVNPQLKEKDSEIIDEGWFYAAEVSHFASYLLKGKVRFIEALCAGDASIICTSEHWTSLAGHLQPHNCLKLRGFLEQCRGQAVGSIAKKSKSTGKMRLTDGATLYEFCESFRLLHHASCVLAGQPLQLNSIDPASLPSGVQQEALIVLRQAYQADQCDKLAMFEVVMRWKAEVDERMKKYQYTTAAAVERCVGRWLTQVRTDGRPLPEPHAIIESDRPVVRSLLDDSIGGPVAAMEPDNIIMIARAGSYLYGLNTASSDLDYLIIYADPIQKVLSSCNRPVECMESRGPEKALEYGAYEVRRFCEMAWKGSVVILELIFSDNLEYISPAWKELVSNKQLFLTERAILQYFGLIKNNMADIEAKRYVGTKREGKLFYQILHKLYCLEFFLQGELPRIRCEGETKDHIMKIRQGPLEGEISRERLYEECQEKMRSLRERLSQRSSRLPENISYSYLSSWLINVRGWNIDT